MVLFTIMIIGFLIAIFVGLITVVVGSASFLVVFGDIFICVVILVFIIKAIIRRRRK